MQEHPRLGSAQQYVHGYLWLWTALYLLETPFPHRCRTGKASSKLGPSGRFRHSRFSQARVDPLFPRRFSRK